MATYLSAVPSMGGETLPTTATSIIRGDEWGIDHVLGDNVIVQEEQITEQNITDQTQDQKGAVVSELDYDKRWDLTLTVLCDRDTAPITGTGSDFSVGDITFKYPKEAVGQETVHYWKVSQVQYTGSYNAKKQYQITAYRFMNWPSQNPA